MSLLQAAERRVFKILLRRREMYWSGLYRIKCGVGLDKNSWISDLIRTGAPQLPPHKERASHRAVKQPVWWAPHLTDAVQSMAKHVTLPSSNQRIGPPCSLKGYWRKILQFQKVSMHHLVQWLVTNCKNMVRWISLGWNCRSVWLTPRQHSSEVKNAWSFTSTLPTFLRSVAYG